jgi:ABC-2 type transport system ATP-binding protein
VFLTTQYLEEADRLAHRVALVDGGRVVAEGTPARLKREVGEAGVELTFASVADAARVGTALAGATLDGARLRVPTDGSVAHVRTVLSAVEAVGVAPEHWEVRAPSLDDVFLALTGHADQEPSTRPAGVAA